MNHRFKQASKLKAPPSSGIDPAQFRNLFTAVMLPMFLGAVDQTLLATATPHIAADLGGLSSTSWISVAYLLAATVMAPIYGRVGDRLGRKPALLASLMLFLLGSVVCGAAPGLAALIGGRALQGLGGGGLMVLSQALIGELVPPRLRPRYQGYFAIVFTASSVGGPVLGGFMVYHASWRWLFFINVPLCLFALWRVSRLPRSTPANLRDAPLDPVGVILFAISACSALSWVSFSGHRFAWESAQSFTLLSVFAASGVTLLVQQRHHPAPFLPVDVLRIPGVHCHLRLGGLFCSRHVCAGLPAPDLFALRTRCQCGQRRPAITAPHCGHCVRLDTDFAYHRSHGTADSFAPVWPRIGLTGVAGHGMGARKPRQHWRRLGGLRTGVWYRDVQCSAVHSGTRRARALGCSGGFAVLGEVKRSSAWHSRIRRLGFRPSPVARSEPERLSMAEGMASLGTSGQNVEWAFRMTFGAMAAFVALGAWSAWRVPPVSLELESQQVNDASPGENL